MREMAFMLDFDCSLVCKLLSKVQHDAIYICHEVLGSVTSLLEFT